MREDKIRNLIREADRMAPGAGAVSAGIAGAVRRRVRIRRIRRIAVSMAAVVVILVGVGVRGMVERYEEG